MFSLVFMVVESRGVVKALRRTGKGAINLLREVHKDNLWIGGAKSLRWAVTVIDN